MLVKLIFHINYYQQLDKLQIFVNLFSNHSSVNLKLSKTQISRTPSSWFLAGFGALADPLMKFGLPLAKSVLLIWGVTIKTSVNAGIQKAIHGRDVTLLISNEELNDIKRIKSLRDSVLIQIQIE